jgi:hypothetical protein
VTQAVVRYGAVRRVFSLGFATAALLLTTRAYAAHGVRHPYTIALPAGTRFRLERSPVETSAAPAPRIRPVGPAATAAPSVVPRPLVAATPVVSTGTITVLRDTDIKAELDIHSGVPTEPCAAKNGDDVLFTDNFHAILSTDGGATFGTVNPSQFLPKNAGLLGDQSVLYDPAHDVFVWSILYQAKGIPGGVAVAVAHGQADFEAGRFMVHYLSPKALHLGRGAFDFPQLATGTNDLYLSANIFTKLDSGGRFLGSTVVRAPLADLATGTPTSVEVFRGNQDHFTFGLAQGAGTTMYFAAHAPVGFGLRLYNWPEGQAVGFDDLDLQPWGVAAGVCAGPDNHEWCGRLDSRVVTGWVANGVVGFMWSASQMAPDRPFPYVGVARINEKTHALLDQPDMFSPDFAIQFPSVGVNARGDLAGAVATGGGARYPGVAAFIQDALSGPAPTWELHDLIAGNSGPAEDRWGDFFCSRPDWPGGNTWVMTGYVLRGGDASYTASHQHFFRVGRPADVDCSQPDLCADDGNSCTADVCVTGACQHPSLPDGTKCLDANGCTAGETCTGGACGGGVTAPCAADTCNFESCTPADGCTFPSAPQLPGLACRFQQDSGTSSACGALLPGLVTKRVQQAAKLVGRTGGSASSKQKRLNSALKKLNQAGDATNAAATHGMITPACDGATIAWLRRLFVDVVATLDQL